MLNKGFKEQIYDVYRYLPPSTQVRFCQNRIDVLKIYQKITGNQHIYDILLNIWFFQLIQVALISATLPHEILEMTSKFMTDPIRILVKRDELTLEGKIVWSYLCKLCYTALVLVKFQSISLYLQVSNSFSWLLKEKNGNSTHFVTCTIH